MPLTRSHNTSLRASTNARKSRTHSTSLASHRSVRVSQAMRSSYDQVSDVAASSGIDFALRMPAEERDEALEAGIVLARSIITLAFFPCTRSSRTSAGRSTNGR